MPRKVWILTGNEENWERAIADKIWGVREGNLKRQWEKLEKDDLLLFYAKSPIGGLIGLGLVESRFKQDKPIWPDELREKRVIYPYRFGFNIIYVLTDTWGEKRIGVADLRLPYQAGLNLLSREEAIGTILGRAKEKWGVDIPAFSIEIKEAPKRSETVTSLHHQIRDMLYEIGLLEKFISEKEYHLDGERLDVAWRRVVRGVPTKVFEVQMGGNIHQALAKLKHAYDLWNSEIFLVIDPKHKQKTEELLSGTFHEIADIIKVFTLDEVQLLYSWLTDVRNLEDKMGLS